MRDIPYIPHTGGNTRKGSKKKDGNRLKLGNMAVAVNSFDSWLSEKLQALNTDEGVFGSYIKGILEGDESEDEKTEALEGILSGITVRTTWIVRLGTYTE